MAKEIFKSKVTLVKSFLCNAEVRNFKVSMDETECLDGTDKAKNKFSNIEDLIFNT